MAETGALNSSNDVCDERNILYVLVHGKYTCWYMEKKCVQNC